MNNAIFIGTVCGNFDFDHECRGEKFYRTYICIERASGAFDVLPVVVSERIFNVSDDVSGSRVCVEGRVSTINIGEGQNRKLEVFIFATTFDTYSELSLMPDTNDVKISGYVCKKPIYRKTPLGRDISDLIIAVNRSYGRSDYIPCIAWGRNAIWSETLEVGEKLYFVGRLQSREYTKRLPDETVVQRVAYELSVREISIDEEGE